MASVRSRLPSYIALTKPRIIELLLVTTVPSMVLAAGGWPGTRLVAATVVGGTLSAAGANALNQYLERDVDAVMRRTRRRPLPSAALEPDSVLKFGIALGVGGFLVLWWEANLLAGVIASIALLFYLYVYTIGLKRSSHRNIVIGGAAGAAPVLVGWTAVTGSLALAAWVLFAVVFYWTPPHFWALALRYSDDYASAGIPMLPVVKGVRATTQQIVGYSATLVFVSLWLIPAAGLGVVYLVVASGLGVWLLVESLRLLRDPRRAMALFRVSTIYLALLFGSIWADVIAR